MIKILRFIDTYIFGFIILLFCWIRYLPRKSSPLPKKILVIRIWALGSSLLTYPMIHELRKNFPDVTIHLLASKRNQSVYRNQGIFDAIFDVFSWKGLWHMWRHFLSYDVVIDAKDYFHLSALISLWTGKKTIWYGNLTARRLTYTHPILYNDTQHAVLTFLDLLTPLNITPKIPDTLGKFHYQAHEITDAKTLFSPQWYYICLHIGGAETSPERFWSVDKWVKLIQKIHTSLPNAKMILTGTQFEAGNIHTLLKILPQSFHTNIINTCGQLNLDQLAYVLETSHLTISNDTGVMHLSASMNTPTIGLFWPNLPSRFWPYPQDKHIALYKGDGIPSINVHLRQFYPDTKHQINAISVDDVWGAIQHIFNTMQTDEDTVQIPERENH